MSRRGAAPRHSAFDMVQLQSLDLDAKVQATLLRIKAWHEYFDGDVYVAYSGGKDSTVLLHLVRSLYPGVKAVFHDTGVEFPEIRRFVMATPNVDITKPKMTFRQVIEKEGYPLVSKRSAQYVREARTTKSDGLYRLRMEGIRGDGSFSPKARIPQKWQRLMTDAPFKISDRCCAVLKHRPAAVYEKPQGSTASSGPWQLTRSSAP